VQTPQGNKTIQAQKARGPAAMGQVATPQPRQQTQPPRSYNDGARPQPPAAAPQLRLGPVVREAAQTPTGMHTPRSSGMRQEQMAQRPATTGQQGMPQPRQETQQQQSYNEVQRPQPQAAGPQTRPGSAVREAAQTRHVDKIIQEQKPQSPSAIGQVAAPQSRQENQPPRSNGGRKDH